MTAIQDLESRFRDLVNSPRLRQSLSADKHRWNRICSAMDVVGDAELAIDAYVAGPPQPPSPGSLYLAVYGILQVMVVEQDALRCLAEELAVQFELPDELAHIRDVRIASIGHPTDIGRGRERRVGFISRATLQWQGFDLWIASGNDFQQKHIDIKMLIEDQRRLISSTLASLIERLSEEELQHRRRFRGQALESMLHAQLGYALEKLREGIRNPSLTTLAEWGLETAVASVSDFTEALAARGVNEGYAGVPPALDQIRQPLARLKDYLAGQTALEPNDALVYVHYVNCCLDELRQIAKEIDAEYASDTV